MSFWKASRIIASSLLALIALLISTFTAGFGACALFNVDPNTSVGVFIFFIVISAWLCLVGSTLAAAMSKV
jgi:hypothetical protein